MLKTLPESIGQLTALEKLQLNSNELKSLPETIGQLTALRILHLYENQLTELPETLKNLTNLETAWVDMVNDPVVKYLNSKGVDI